MLPLQRHTGVYELQSILQVKNLTGGYKEAVVMFDVSLEVPRGAVTAIVGRNGAGKTTLLRTISGFLNQTSGEILLDGKDVSKLAPHERALAGIKYVRQDKRVFGDLTVDENLALAAYPSKDREGIAKVLEVFPKLKVLNKNKARGLSGGERQMLLLAQGLIGNTKVLLLDEPTEGLAPIVIKELERSFDVFKELGKTIVLVEQNLAVVRRHADNLYVMKEGRMAISGASREEMGKLELEAHL